MLACQIEAKDARVVPYKIYQVGDRPHSQASCSFCGKSYPFAASCGPCAASWRYRGANHALSITATLHPCPYCPLSVPLMREHDLLSLAWTMQIAPMTVWIHLAGDAVSRGSSTVAVFIAPQFPIASLVVRPRFETLWSCGVPGFARYSLLEKNSTERRAHPAHAEKLAGKFGEVCPLILTTTVSYSMLSTIVVCLAREIRVDRASPQCTRDLAYRTT